MLSGDALTRWAVRLALALAAVALMLRAHGRPGARLLWTAGYAAFLAHVAAAFHFFHGWSHAAAYESTARRTAAAVGVASGGGLYLNYLFLAVWGIDVAWWWRDPSGYRRRSVVAEVAVQGFLLFIAFNAAVVFVEGPTRWASLAGLMLLAVVLLRAVTKRYNRPVGSLV